MQKYLNNNRLLDLNEINITSNENELDNNPSSIIIRADLTNKKKLICEKFDITMLLLDEFAPINIIWLLLAIICSLIEEASKAISYALTTLIWSIITFILNDRPIYQINCNQDFGQSYQNESSHSYVILNALTKLNISSISKTCLDYNEGDNCNSDDFSQLNCSIDRIRYVYISYDFVDETFENYLNTV
ncbi:unnamed protein product [Rotaria sp. Silwood2]|nr:unnamed protein product [Rotaria sp. Silwood2]